MSSRQTLLLASLFLFVLPLSAEERDPGTAFAVAIESHDNDTIKEMLSKGISTETPITYGEHAMTPLIKAAWDGDEQIVTTLLAAGAKVNAQATDTLHTALMNAVTRGHMPVVHMLIKAGADVTPKSKFDFNAFTSAVAAGRQDLAAVLLDAGAKIEDGASGLSPLQFAASAGNIDMIQFLVNRGADVNHGVKKGGQTALLSAIYSAKPAAVQALIDLKANVTAKTKDGSTPLSVAQNGDQEDIIAILKAAGAKK